MWDKSHSHGMKDKSDFIKYKEEICQYNKQTSHRLWGCVHKTKYFYPAPTVRTPEKSITRR